MKVGMNMLLWTPSVGEEHHGIFADLKATGFDGAEIPIGEENPDYYPALGKILDDNGLARTAVMALDEAHNPVSPDPKIRQAAVERLAWGAEMCAALGADRIVGPIHSAYPVFTGKGPTEDEKSWCVDVLREASERSAAHGVTLAVEPLNRFECYMMNTAEQAAEIIRRIDHPNCVMLYDTHHMHIEEKDIVTAISETADTIGHIHISENDRGTPGKGQVNWADSFSSLKKSGYDGWLVIEAFSRLDPEFAAMIHIWRDFFVDPAEVYTEGYAFIQRMWAEA